MAFMLGSTPAIEAGGMSARNGTGGRLHDLPPIPSGQLRMVNKFLNGVELRVGNLAGFQAFDNLCCREGRGNAGYDCVEVLTVLHAAGIRDEALI